MVEGAGIERIEEGVKEPAALMFKEQTQSEAGGRELKATSELSA